MGFKRIDYDSGEEIFDLKIISGYGTERWKAMRSDFPRVIKILNKKYNLNLIIKERGNSDIGWALQ